MQTNIYFYINAFQHTIYSAGAQVEALTSISETLPGIVSKLEIESNVSLINNHVEKNQQQQVAKNAPSLSIRDLPQCYGNRNVSLLLLLRVTYLWCLFSFRQLFINRNGGR